MKNQFNCLIRNNKIVLLFLISVIFKLIFSALLPVAGDEAYYWVWGKNLQLSYFDHPPAVAWMTFLSNIMYNQFPLNLNWLAIRLPFIIVSSFTFVIWLKIFTQENKDNINIIIFAALYLLNPLLGLGGLFATPDVPLLFFWSLAYWSVTKIFQTSSTFWYSVLGIFLGLGFCSKYHIVFFPITLLISLYVEKKLSVIKINKLFFTFIFGLLFSLPVLIWNYQNDWVSFLFQINHGLNAQKFNWTWPITYIIGQILLFNPILIYFIFNYAQKSITKKMALSQWAFFSLSSFKALVEANWPITAHAQGLIAINSKFKKYFKFSLIYWIIFWLMLIGLSYTNFGKNKINQFPQSTAALDIYEKTKKFRPLYGPNYQMTSLLQLVSSEKIIKLNQMARYDFYDTMVTTAPAENNYFVLKYNNADWPSYLSEAKISTVIIFPEYELKLYRVIHE